ncbi:unnamed protein product [Rodentolepis nana]|uniref:Transcription initiation factor TFIID subunit 12 n=1 Tax=Rodentolepis nana TaxID=102285 RepID=A0A0R3T8Q5_RODNA|nr:unnamed protein product [Rodentolepis nana]
MSGISKSNSSSPSKQNNTCVASVPPSVAAPAASVPDLPLIPTSNISSPTPCQQTHSQISTPLQAPTLDPNQMTSATIILPNQIPVVTSPANPIVFTAAPCGSAVTVSVNNVSKPAGTVLTAATRVVSVSSIPVIRSVTSLSASSTTAVSSQPCRHESPQQQIHQSQQLQIPAFESKSLKEVMKEVDPYLQLDENSEEVLRAVAEEFLESVAKKSVKIASHRGSVLVEPKDVEHILGQLVLIFKSIHTNFIPNFSVVFTVLIYFISIRTS